MLLNPWLGIFALKTMAVACISLYEIVTWYIYFIKCGTVVDKIAKNGACWILNVLGNCGKYMLVKTQMTLFTMKL